jgi:hypothetical protein
MIWCRPESPGAGAHAFLMLGQEAPKILNQNHGSIRIESSGRELILL